MLPLPNLQASSLIGSRTVYIWDEVLKNDIRSVKKRKEFKQNVLMAHQYITDSSVFE